jgi:hypothetical protein
MIDLASIAWLDDVLQGVALTLFLVSPLCYIAKRKELATYTIHVAMALALLLIARNW